jgi:hypothetical protein
MHESLRRHWPPEGQILLLTAALADLDAARQAWRQWNEGRELGAAPPQEVRLLSAVALRMPELEPDAPPDPRLVGTRRYIWTHTQMTLGTVRPLLATMSADGLRVMLMKGAARLATDPFLAQVRALRDIDVLIHPQDWERGLRLAQREGWQHAGQNDDLAALRRAHAIGLRSGPASTRSEFDLHRFVLHECRNEGQDSGIWARAFPVRFLGLELSCASVTDQALITLAQAVLYSPSMQVAHWALDVDPAIRAAKIDWAVLLDEVHTRLVRPYVAAPLLLLQERIGCPIPSEVLADLTRPIGKHYLVEFEARATGFGPKHPEQFDAARIVGSARAMRVARMTQYAGSDRPSLPAPVRGARLGPDQAIDIPVPAGAAPYVRLRLYLEFDVHRARGHAYLKIMARDVALMLVPIGRASKTRGGRVRRRVVVHCPACAFALRHADRVRICTNDRLAIRNVVMSWERPAARSPLQSLAVVLRGLWRSRGALRYSSAG